jgi:adenosylcobinamide-phosphate synthase
LSEIEWYIVLAAFILDFIFGDPKWLPHPIIYMGKAIDFFEIWFRRYVPDLLVSGAIFAGFLILTTWFIASFVIQAGIEIHPVLGDGIKLILLFFCFSSTSLEKAAMKVHASLEKNDLQKARENVAMIVGRQTHNLDEKGITRASIETVAENFVDGFISPLFFALIGGVPLALAFKMVNTLDSMVGYKNEKYILFGRASARIDDVANFIPARLSVFIIGVSLFFKSFKEGIGAIKTGFKQGSLHKSPNAGYPEATFAGALRIRLGGPNYYHGTLVEKPYIGKAFKDPGKEKIRQACDLMILSSFIAILISCFVLAV